MKPLAIEADLEKYFDIYEISHADVLDLGKANSAESSELGEDSLKAFKAGLQKLHLARKLFLCSLLALGVDGTRSDRTKWSAVARTLNALSAETGQIATTFDGILGVEEANSADTRLPTTPTVSLTPARERLRSQMKKLNSLSQGFRGVQAMVHLLREDAENLAGIPLQLSATAAERYDSVGNELKVLLEEWEEGRNLFKYSIETRDNHLALPSLPKTAPSSPTMSLGGSTAVEGSPPDALRPLQGCGSYHRSSSSTATSSAGEEVLEAIALSRQRSTLSREERIVKMKEDRARLAMARSKAEATLTLHTESSMRILSEAVRGGLGRYQALIQSSARSAVRASTVVEEGVQGILKSVLKVAVNLLHQVVDAIKDLVQDCNFDCNDSGIALQAMDNSHVALVSMMLKAESFSPFRCDRNIALGINLSSLMKVLRCAQNEDILTLKADDAPDVVNLVFETSESDRLSEYDIKLMDIDQEHLGIPETEYAATISMPSPEFQRICRDLMALSESVAIEASKDGVKFSCTGDIGNGAVTLRSHTNVENPEKNIEISLSEPVALTFSLKYLVNFCKASGLSGTVKLCLSNEVPLLVEYTLASNSYLRFYLAPKVGRHKLRNHLGYRQAKGTTTSADEISELYAGLKQSYLTDFDVMLSGYAPSAKAVDAVGAIARDLQLRSSTKPGSFFWGAVSI
ncbi:MAG: hypothetical protein Q9220_007642 [cf. Caloplaca sp. 1 TL-2023]